MRISDWSSDVCSSDLAAPAHGNTAGGDAAGLQRLLLRLEVEEFLYREADLIDSRRFDDWLDTLADDLSYFMPIRRNVKYGTHEEHENTRQGRDISWFDEDKWNLCKRFEPRPEERRVGKDVGKKGRKR